MEKIAIFGGAFNPIHKGHIHLAESMRDRYHLDRVLLIPSHIPPHKEAPDLVSGEHRLMMCALVAKEHPGFQAEDIELSRPGKSYTVDTVQALSARYPGSRLYLIVGSDMLFTFDEWRRYEDILRYATLLAGARNPDEYKRLCQKAAQLKEKVPEGEIFVSDIPVEPMSSTQIREGFRRGEDMTNYLEPAVLQYIRERGLYSPMEASGA